MNPPIRYVACLVSVFIGSSTGVAGPGEKGRPKTIPQFEDWEGERNYGQTVSEDVAGFTVYTLEKEPIPLASLWSEKPLLLVHSSITCPISRDNCPHIDRIQGKYGGELEVIVLYTTEAHPVGSPSPYSETGKEEWITDRNLAENVLFDEPLTIEERIQRAREYRDAYGIESTVVVDSMSNEAWEYFGGGPNTGMLITTEGKLRFRQGWMRAPELEGEVRQFIAAKKDNEIREKIARAGLRLNYRRLSEPELEEAIRKVPEIVRYHVNSRSFRNDESLLHLAVNDENAAIASALLDHGSPLDIKDQVGRTPLHYALQKTRPDAEASDLEPLIQLLIDRGANIRERSDDLRTSVHYAVDSGSLNHVRLAVDHGASPDSASIDGATPLHDALFQDKKEIAEWLIQQGAGEDIYVAAALGDQESVNRFLRARPEDWARLQGNSGRTPLMYAVVADQIDLVRFFLAQQSDSLRYSDKHLSGCVTKALKFGRTEVAETLVPHVRLPQDSLALQPSSSIRRQIPPSQHYWGFPPEPLLHDAAEKNEPEVVAALLDRGWDVDELNDDEQTPLHVAARSGATKSIQLLIDRGANIHFKSGRERYYPCGPPESFPLKRTPLHEAVLGGNPDAVEMLLKNGSRLEARDHEGSTPILSLFLSHADDFSDVKAIFHILVQAGANPSDMDESGRTLKSMASELMPDYQEIGGELNKVGEKMQSPELFGLLDQYEKSNAGEPR